MVDCAASLAKIILFVFNVILWLLSLALIILSIVVLVRYGSVEGDVLKGCAIVVLALSIFTFIITFSGCWGAVRESRCLLQFYIGLLCVIILVGVVLVILLAVKKDTIAESLVKYFDKIKSDYPTPGKSSLTDEEKLSKGLWDVLLQENECCAGNDKVGAALWQGVSAFKGDIKVPATCCKVENYQQSIPNEEDKAKACSSNASNQYTKDCYEAVKKNFLSVIPGLLILIGLVALAPVFGILFAVCLCTAIKNNN